MLDRFWVLADFEHLPDTYPDCRKVVSFLRATRHARPIFRIMKSRMENPSEVSASTRLYDGACAKHLTLRVLIQLVLNCMTVTVPYLAADGRRVSRQEEIRLFAANNSVHSSFKQIAYCEREVDVLKLAAMDDLHGLTHLGPAERPPHRLYARASMKETLHRQFEKLLKPAIVGGAGAARVLTPSDRQGVLPMERADRGTDDCCHGVVVACVVHRPDDGLLGVSSVVREREEGARYGFEGGGLRCASCRRVMPTKRRTSAPAKVLTNELRYATFEFPEVAATRPIACAVLDRRGHADIIVSPPMCLGVPPERSAAHLRC